MQRIFISLGFLLAATGMWAETYYVDYSSGSNSNSGLTQSAPFRHAPGDAAATGNSASITLVAGDRVVFKGGVQYFGEIDIEEGGTSDSNRIVYSGSGNGWGTGRAIINGSNSRAHGFISSWPVNYVTIEGFEIRNLAEGNSWGVKFTRAGTGLVIRDNHVEDVGTYSTTDTDGGGIYLMQATDFLVSGNEVTDVGYIGIEIIGGQDGVIEDNRIHGWINWGIDIASDYRKPQNILITGNTIYNLFQYDKGFWEGPDSSMPHSDYIFVRGRGDSMAAENIIVDGNLFYNDYSFSTFGGTGMIYFSWVFNCTMRNNVFINPHSYYAVHVNDGSGHAIYNNTFYTPRSGTTPLRLYGTSAPADLTVKNNLFVAPYDDYAIAFGSNYDLQGLDIDNNLYTNADFGHMIHLESPWDGWDLTAWQADGWDTNGVGVSAISAVEFFDTAGFPASSSTMDLRISADSPAVGAGENLSALFTTDFAGNPRPASGPWDIGAFQVSSTGGGGSPDPGDGGAPPSPSGLRIEN